MDDTRELRNSAVITEGARGIKMDTNILLTVIVIVQFVVILLLVDIAVPIFHAGIFWQIRKRLVGKKKELKTITKKVPTGSEEEMITKNEKKDIETW